jgi:hypothetical protein
MRTLVNGMVDVVVDVVLRRVHKPLEEGRDGR